MAKYILRILFFMTVVAVAAPLSAHVANDNAVSVSQAGEEIRLSVSGQNVRVQNAQGETLEVFSITGTKVASFRIDAADKSVTLNLTRGCYIIKVKNVVRKVSVL